MKAVVQRVSAASVSIEGQTVGSCQKGLMVLLGVAAEDTEDDARMMAQKLVKLRIFCDENGKMKGADEIACMIRAVVQSALEVLA